MKVIDFDGKEHILKLQGKQVLNDDIRPKSSYHLEARKLLKRLYPFSPIYEEVYLPCGLYVDFLIPAKRLAFEVDGKQHSEFVPHFHGSKAGFLKSQKRDSMKIEFCQLNNIKLSSLSYQDSIEEWEKQLRAV